MKCPDLRTIQIISASLLFWYSLYTSLLTESMDSEEKIGLIVFTGIASALLFGMIMAFDLFRNARVEERSEDLH